MYKVYYRFDTLASFVEKVTDLRVGRANALVGVRAEGVFGHRIGRHARRHHPFGALLVLPIIPPPAPYIEQPEEGEGEPELIFSPLEL